MPFVRAALERKIISCNIKKIFLDAFFEHIPTTANAAFPDLFLGLHSIAFFRNHCLSQANQSVLSLSILESISLPLFAEQQKVTRTSWLDKQYFFLKAAENKTLLFLLLSHVLFATYLQLEYFPIMKSLNHSTNYF